jgi:MerR family transcriptional regulator, thiopeptide resistance regulator
MIKGMIVFTVKRLADLAGVSVRTLHYYDQIGLLKPKSYSQIGYRQYDEEDVVRLQQIMFFRELDFGLGEIQKIMAQPGFNVLEALQSHQILLAKKTNRMNDLRETVERTIRKMKGEVEMEIKEYYQGFSDQQIAKYRDEVRHRWGEDTLNKSEARVTGMGKEKFAALQDEAGEIFKTISLNMSEGVDSPKVQEQIGRWRQWLENFYTYSDEAVLGLGRVYSQHEDFVAFFNKIHPGLPEFMTQAIEYYCRNKGLSI